MKKTMKELCAKARAIVTDYEPDCDEERYEHTVLRLTAIGFKMVEAASGAPAVDEK